MTEPMFSGKLASLSNFHQFPFFVYDLKRRVPTAEHAFNALKTLDGEERDWVLAASTPGEAKKRGRAVTLRPGWDTGQRVNTMQKILSYKFSNLDMWEDLWLTGDLKLVETNGWHDQFWGDCYCPKHKDIPGTNMLGELLMSIRESRR
jgi:ribA/ribD-fused uncharacterized protein